MASAEQETTAAGRAAPSEVAASSVRYRIRRTCTLRWPFSYKVPALARATLAIPVREDPHPPVRRHVPMAGEDPAELVRITRRYWVAFLTSRSRRLRFGFARKGPHVLYEFQRKRRGAESIGVILA